MLNLDGGTITQRLVLDLSNYNANFARADHTMTANVARIGSLGQTLTKYIVAPMALIGGYSVKSAVDFEHSMAKLNTLANQSASQLKTTSDQMLQISNSTGVAATQVAQMGYDALSSSVKIDQMGKVVKVAANLSKAGFADADASLKLLTSTYNVYSDTFSKDTSQADAMQQIADKMMVLQNLGVTTVGEMSSMLGNVTPMAHAAGLSIDEIVASLAQLTLGGLQSGEAVTGLRSILSDVVKPGDHARAVAKALGLEFNATAIKSKGFSGFLTDMRQKLEQTHPAFLKVSDTVATLQSKINGATKEQKSNKTQMQQWRAELTEAKKELKYLSKGGDSTIGTLGQLFGSVEALGAMLSLTSKNGVEGFNKALIGSQNAAGVTDKALKTLEETTAEKFAKATTQLKNASIVLGTHLLPTVTKVIEKVSKLALSFQKADPEKLSNAIKTGLNVALGILAVTITSKALLAVTNIVNGFKAMQTVLGALNLLVVANPVVAIIGAITLAAAADIIYIKNYNDEMRKLNKNIKEMDNVEIRGVINNTKEKVAVQQNKAGLLDIKSQLQTKYREKDKILGDQKGQYQQYEDLLNILVNPAHITPSKANNALKKKILEKYYPKQSTDKAFKNANKDYQELIKIFAPKQQQIANVNVDISKLKKKLETTYGMKKGANVSDIDAKVKTDNELLKKDAYADNLKKNGLKNVKQYAEATAINGRVKTQLENYNKSEKKIKELESKISKLKAKQSNSKLTTSKVKFTSKDSDNLEKMQNELKKKKREKDDAKVILNANGFTTNGGKAESKAIKTVLENLKLDPQYETLKKLFLAHSESKKKLDDLQKKAASALKKSGGNSTQYKNAQKLVDDQSKALDKIEKSIEKTTKKNWKGSKEYFKTYDKDPQAVKQYKNLESLFSQYDSAKNEYDRLNKQLSTAKRSDQVFGKFGLKSDEYQKTKKALETQIKAMGNLENQVKKITGKNWNDSKTYFKKLGNQKLEVKQQVSIKPKVTTDKGGAPGGGSGSGTKKTIDQIKAEFEDKMSNIDLKLDAGVIDKKTALNDYKWLEKQYAKYPELTLKAKKAVNDMNKSMTDDATTKSNKTFDDKFSAIGKSIEKFEQTNQIKLNNLKASGKSEDSKEYLKAVKDGNDSEIKLYQNKIKELEKLKKGASKDQLDRIKDEEDKYKLQISNIKAGSVTDKKNKTSTFDIDVENIQKPLEQIQTANKNKINDMIAKGLKEGSLAYIEEQEKQAKAELDVKKKVYSDLMAYRNKYIKTMSEDDKKQLGKDLTDLNADIKASAADATKSYTEELQARYDASQKWIEKQKQNNKNFTKNDELVAWQRVASQHKGTDLGQQAQDQIISVKAEIRQTDLDDINKPFEKLQQDSKVKLAQAIAGGVKEGSIAYIALQEKMAGQELVSQKQALDNLKAYHEKYQSEMTTEEKSNYEKNLSEETLAYYDAVNNQANYKKQAMEALYNEEKDRISNAMDIAGMTATDAMHEWENVAKEFEGTDWGLEALKEVKTSMDKIHDEALNKIKEEEDKAQALLDTAKDNAVDSINTEKDAWSDAYDDKVDKFTKAQDKIVDGYKKELKAIEDTYDAQDRDEDVASNQADLEKYKDAIGIEGQRKYAEALKKKRDLERDAQKAALQTKIDNAETTKSNQLTQWEEENKKKLKGYEDDTKAIETKYKTDTATTKQHYIELTDIENNRYSEEENSFASHNQTLLKTANDNITNFQNAGITLGTTFSNGFITSLKPTLDYINTIKTALANVLTNKAAMTELGQSLTQTPKAMPGGPTINNATNNSTHNSTQTNDTKNSLNVTLNDYSTNQYTSGAQVQKKTNNIVDDITKRATARGIRPIIG